MWSHTSSVFVLSTSNWVHATHTYEILKLENMNGDGCYMQLYFSDKLSSLRLLDMSAPSVRHVWDNRFSSIRHDPEYAFTPLIIFLPPPPVGGDLDDSTTIYSLLLPTCKVHEGDSSHHRIGPLPIGFVPPLRCHGNSIVFNLVFSFPSFSIFQVDSFGQDTCTMLQNIVL
jgi:hypothetical protein